MGLTIKRSTSQHDVLTYLKSEGIVGMPANHVYDIIHRLSVQVFCDIEVSFVEFPPKMGSNDQKSSVENISVYFINRSEIKIHIE